MRRFQLMQRVNIEGLYGAVQAALPHLKRSTSTAGGRIVIVSPPIYSRFFRGKTAYAMGKVGMSVLTMGLGMDFARQGLVRAGKGGMAVASIWPAVVSLEQKEPLAMPPFPPPSPLSPFLVLLGGNRSVCLNGTNLPGGPLPKKKSIQSAATEQFTRQNPSEASDLRRPTIFSDAILAILRAPASEVNGQLFLDEDFLRDHCGVSDFSKYSVVPGSHPRRIMPAELPDLSVKEQADEGKRYDSAKARKGRETKL